MRCERCYGQGQVYRGDTVSGFLAPCEECNGSGVIYCCEGATGPSTIPETPKGLNGPAETGVGLAAAFQNQGATGVDVEFWNPFSIRKAGVEAVRKALEDDDKP